MAPVTGNITLAPEIRRRLVEFLIKSADEFQVHHMVKYSALTLFADRFYPCLSTTNKLPNHWLLRRPIRESNLQIFALVSLWISSKSHSSRPLPLQSLKSLADKLISEQVFTKADFVQAETVFVRSVRFEIGTLNTPFVLLDELLDKIRGVAMAGKLLSVEACLDILDLLYETEEFSEAFRNPILLAASILVSAYAITVPKQISEFPVVPWVKFTTSCPEEEITELVRRIFSHILRRSACN